MPDIPKVLAPSTYTGPLKGGAIPAGPRARPLALDGLRTADEHVDRKLIVHRPAAAGVDVDYSAGIADWDIMGNDVMGDCVPACMGHVVEGWTANASTRTVIARSKIVGMYSDITKYDIATGAND